MQNLGQVRKIAILRANAIGDYVFSLPALNALRSRFPDAELVYLGLRWHADFLTGRPGPVDRVVVLPPVRGVGYPESWQEDPAEVEAFIALMQEEEFDLALQMHGGGRHSNPFVKRLGARLTVGLCAAGSEPLDVSIPYIYYQPEILRYLEVVSLVGAVQTTLLPQLAVTEADLAEADELAPQGDVPFVLLHPGAGDPRRRWPVEKFASVGSALLWMGAQVAVVGIERDVHLADAIASSISGPVLNLCGRTSLAGLLGLIARASVVISNDSGPLHLATAVGTPTVGIYWCGNMIVAGPLSRTMHRPAISWSLHCPVCGLDCTRSACDHEESFVASVPQEEVLTSAIELIKIGEKGKNKASYRLVHETEGERLWVS
jgi:ADP-heptose:LPS heptosyltransferase